jgi:hypothetical protein
MNIEQKSSSWLKNRYWLLPAAMAVIAILLMLLPAYWIGSLPLYTARIQQSEKQRKIVTYTIQTPKGEIVVTELRSGTEFNRILQMPDGKVIAEAGWINRWAEEQIRMIGTARGDE